MTEWYRPWSDVQLERYELFAIINVIECLDNEVALIECIIILFDELEIKNNQDECKQFSGRTLALQHTIIC